MSADESGSQTVKSTKSTDCLTRVIAIIAFVMSTFTFSLQFMAHDSLSIATRRTTIITDTHTDTGQALRNLYFNIPLVLFNTGNRAAALVSARASIVKRALLSNQQTVTDDDCRLPVWNGAGKWPLFAIPTGSDGTHSDVSALEFSGVIKRFRCQFEI